MGSGGSGGSAAGASADVCSGGYGQIVCDGTKSKICDGKGGFSSVVDCAMQGSSCQPGLGCVACKPNSSTCDEATKLAKVCDASGNWSTPFICDGPGVHCDGNQRCVGACSPASLASRGGNQGCDFWPTVTANPVWSDLTHTTMSGAFRFGVLVGNVSTQMATLTVTSNGSPAPSPALNNSGSLVLEPGEAKYIPLSWVPELKGPDWATTAAAAFTPVTLPQSVLKRSGAYHLVSNQPIIAYQFSPIEASIGDNGNGSCPWAPENGPNQGCYSYSTDASLLIPSHRLGTDYVVTSYRASRQAAPSAALPNVGDFLAITASQPNTKVKITPRPGQSILAGVDGARTDGTPFMLNLGEGDVVQLFTPGTSDRDSFSGTLVQEVSGQNHPLQLLTGLGCGEVPAGTYPCGHLEDPVLPRTLLGNEYVVPAIYLQYSGADGNKVGPMPYTLRIQAISDGTDLTFEPASMYRNVTLSSGQVLEIPGTLDARISSSTAFAVTQYLNGGSPKSDQGGPNQLALLARSQYQTSYQFVVPDSRLLPDSIGSANFTNVVAILAPTGALVYLDGVLLRPDQLLPIGASGMSVSRQTLNGNDKVHEVHADHPFGIVVYGAANYTTYLYSGG